MRSNIYGKLSLCIVCLLLLAGFMIASSSSTYAKTTPVHSHTTLARPQDPNYCLAVSAVTFQKTIVFHTQPTGTATQYGVAITIKSNCGSPINHGVVDVTPTVMCPNGVQKVLNTGYKSISAGTIDSVSVVETVYCDVVKNNIVVGSIPASGIILEIESNAALDNNTIAVANKLTYKV